MAPKGAPQRASGAGAHTHDGAAGADAVAVALPPLPPPPLRPVQPHAPQQPAPAPAPPAVALCLDAFDGVRGLAAVVVVLGHMFTFFMPLAVARAAPGDDDDDDAAADSEFAHGARWPVVGLEYLSPVTLFFVVSGFTLVHVYERPPACADEAPPLSTREQRRAFFRKRLARLAPVYYLGLLLGVVPFVIYTRADVAALAIGFPVSLLGLQSLFLFDCQIWDGPLWTVSAFVLCYACFPPLLCALRRCSHARLRAVCLGCCGASAGIACAFLGATGLSLTWVLHFFALFRLPHFALGVASGLMAQRRPLARPTLRVEICSAVLLLNLLVCAALTAVVVPRASAYVWLLYSHYMEFLIPPVHAVWLSALAAPPPPGCCGAGGGPTRRLLSCRPLRRLGDVSFALYCLHFPILQWAGWAVARRGVSTDAVPLRTPSFITGWFNFTPAAIAPLLAVCIAVAAVAHVALEKPARAAIVQRGGGGGGAANGACVVAAGEEEESGGMRAASAPLIAPSDSRA
jgi:peptidoglycan/LPS O-acetylase OafA/YrhL